MPESGATVEGAAALDRRSERRNRQIGTAGPAAETAEIYGWLKDRRRIAADTKVADLSAIGPKAIVILRL